MAMRMRSAAISAMILVLGLPSAALAQETAEEAVNTEATLASETDGAAADAQSESEESAEPVGPSCPPLLDGAGEPVLGEDGAPVFDETPVPVLDEAGEPMLGEDGAPLTEPCIVPLEAELPADDEALEEAATPAGPFSPLMRLLDAGGPVILILALLAVLALAVGLVKLVQFIWLGVGRAGFVAGAMDKLLAGQARSALDDLDHRRNPVARVMAAALRGNSSPEMNDELVREETTRVAQAQLDGLERGLALLSLIATIAPLLGLLGTVLGMIEAFQQMETVGDRVEPAVLAGGIWEALLTTAAGLSVAIPAAVLFTWFQRAVDVEGQRMEDAATQVFTGPLYRAAKAG